MSVFFTADSCDSLGDGALAKVVFNNRSQRPQPCDLHGEDLERERSAERPTRAVVETVDEVSPLTLVETERGKAPKNKNWRK